MDIRGTDQQIPNNIKLQTPGHFITDLENPLFRQRVPRNDNEILAVFFLRNLIICFPSNIKGTHSTVLKLSLEEGLI